MKPTKFILLASIFIKGSIASVNGNFSSSLTTPGLSKPISTGYLDLGPTTTIYIPSGPHSAVPTALDEPTDAKSRAARLMKSPIDLETWIELYHALYPQEKVQKAKNVVKQKYLSASKLVLKEAVKGLVSEVIHSLKEPLPENVTVVEEDPSLVNSTSLLRKLLGKDLESDDSDSDSDCDSGSGGSSNSESDCDSSDLSSGSDDDCDDYKYSWDYDYESYGSRGNGSMANYTNGTTNITYAPVFNFTNYTLPNWTELARRPPAVVLPVRMNYSNYSVDTSHEEMSAASRVTLENLIIVLILFSVI